MIISKMFTLVKNRYRIDYFVNMDDTSIKNVQTSMPIKLD